MLRNFFLIAVRNLRRHKLFSFINIVGLALGMTVCLMTLMEVKDALAYDSFHPFPGRTYRILTDLTGPAGGLTTAASTPLPLGDVLRREYSFVEKAARVHYGVNGRVSYGRKTLPVQGAFVDPSFFEIFGFPVAMGQVPVQPRTVVLTQPAAERFFGADNPVGKALDAGKMGLLTVTGVLAPLPGKSHLQFDLLVSMATVSVLEQARLLPPQLSDWSRPGACYTYVLLREGVTQGTLDRGIAAVAARVSKDTKPANARRYSFRSQSLAQLTPAPDVLANGTWEPTVTGLLSQGGISLLILLLAGFNYVNLTLARSLSRAREVGIRKVAGAQRYQLAGQFLAESVVLALLALVLANVLLVLIEPIPTVHKLVSTVRPDAALGACFLAFSLVTGLLAGFIPARVLSGYQPAQVLRGHAGPTLFKGLGLRKGLIVVQFAVSLVFIVFVVVVYRQFSFMATASYGFDRSNILNIPLEGADYRRLAGELERQAGVERVSATSEVFGFHPEAGRLSRDGDEFINAGFFAVDAQFVPNMGLVLLAGSNLPVSNPDTAGQFVLLNQEAVRALQLADAREAVGQLVWLDDSTQVQVAGVLKDFHHLSFHFPIRPLVMRYQPDRFRTLQVKVAQHPPASLIANLEKVWRRQQPLTPFRYGWYDQELHDWHLNGGNQLFVGLLTAMALFIACMGLLGMVTYTTALRKKEVGIRKVMGSSVGQVVILLSRSFMGLLLTAGLIALPLGYLVGRNYLQNFAYHIPLGIGILLCSLTGMLLVGAFTVCVQTYRAATVNPLKSLRSE